MKTCPVCKARCFDDMEICYGCMYRFEDVVSAKKRANPAPEMSRGGAEASYDASDPFAEDEKKPPRQSSIGEAASEQTASFFSPSFSLDELFAGMEYRMEITLRPCRK